MTSSPTIRSCVVNTAVISDEDRFGKNSTNRNNNNETIELCTVETETTLTPSFSSSLYEENERLQNEIVRLQEQLKLLQQFQKSTVIINDTEIVDDQKDNVPSTDNVSISNISMVGRNCHGMDNNQHPFQKEVLMCDLSYSSQNKASCYGYGYGYADVDTTPDIVTITNSTGIKEKTTTGNDKYSFFTETSRSIRALSEYFSSNVQLPFHNQDTNTNTNSIPSHRQAQQQFGVDTSNKFGHLKRKTSHKFNSKDSNSTASSPSSSIASLSSFATYQEKGKDTIGLLCQDDVSRYCKENDIPQQYHTSHGGLKHRRRCHSHDNLLQQQQQQQQQNNNRSASPTTQATEDEMLESGLRTSIPTSLNYDHLRHLKNQQLQNNSKLKQQQSCHNIDPTENYVVNSLANGSDVSIRSKPIIHHSTITSSNFDNKLQRFLEIPKQPLLAVQHLTNSLSNHTVRSAAATVSTPFRSRQQSKIDNQHPTRSGNNNNRKNSSSTCDLPIKCTKECCSSNDSNDEHNTTFWKSVHERGMWLIGLLFLQSMSSFIISRNERLLQQHIVIVQFLTMLVGAGGNAGNQASVNVIRGLATGTIHERNIKQYIVNEICLACSLSTVLGIAGCIRAMVFHIPLLETIAITASLITIVFISIVVGCVLPIIMSKWLHIDPAHSSTTIQVIMDILGVLITVHVSSIILDSQLFGPWTTVSK